LTSGGGSHRCLVPGCGCARCGSAALPLPGGIPTRFPCRLHFTNVTRHRPVDFSFFGSNRLTDMHNVRYKLVQLGMLSATVGMPAPGSLPTATGHTRHKKKSPRFLCADLGSAADAVPAPTAAILGGPPLESRGVGLGLAPCRLLVVALYIIRVFRDVKGSVGWDRGIILLCTVTERWCMQLRSV